MIHSNMLTLLKCKDNLFHIIFLFYISLIMPKKLKFIASIAEWKGGGATWLCIHQIKIKVQTSHITFCDLKDQIISQSKWFDLNIK